MIPYILTDDSLTVVLKGESFTMNRANPAFRNAIEALESDNTEQLEAMFDTPKAVTQYVDGNIEVTSAGEVKYKGSEVHNHVVGRILSFMSEGLPYKPLVKFLEKLMENPSRRSTEELYGFLEHKQMPLTPDGNFLAYKGIREDYTDWYSGKFSNKVGETLEMPRNGVCDDASYGCSSGFHAGSLGYAEGYGNGGHLMVVEINPKDVVSVPNDCNCQKLRTAKYKVVDHYKTKLADTYCDDYYEGDSDDESDDESGESYDDGYDAGYDAAIAKIKKNL